jgi:hypothetical protein
MAKPRVFVSSTYYDLKHLRSSLENFISELGYEAVLSEKDTIAYLPSMALDESCYREARNSDIFVLIIGGRYGAAASSEPKTIVKDDFYAAYDSITKQEYVSACSRGIPVYICIEASVDAEYRTYLSNKDNKLVKYAHVDSENIFKLIEAIRNEPKNNPIKLFTKYSEIETWLKEQWAGFFRELIVRQSEAKEIEDIGKKLGDLAVTTETLKRYLEQVVSQVIPKASDPDKFIREENERLRNSLKQTEFSWISYIQHLNSAHGKSFDYIRETLASSSTYTSFLMGIFGNQFPMCPLNPPAFADINRARRLLDLTEFKEEEFLALEALLRGKSLRRRL